MDCDLGDSVFTSKENVAIIDTSAENGAEKEVTADAVIPNNEIGSVFGEGSLTAIVSFLALFISISAIGAIIASNRERKNVAVARGGNSDEH